MVQHLLVLVNMYLRGWRVLYNKVLSGVVDNEGERGEGNGCF